MKVPEAKAMQELQQMVQEQQGKVRPRCVNAIKFYLSEVSALREAGARAGEIRVLDQQQDITSIPRMESLVTCSRLCGKYASTLQTVKCDAAHQQASVLNLLQHCFGGHQPVKLTSNPFPLMLPPLPFFPTLA